MAESCIKQSKWHIALESRQNGIVRRKWVKWCIELKKGKWWDTIEKLSKW